MMESIYLIGFMGSGKTTVAHELAKRCGAAVQDTDRMVEINYELSIKEIFAAFGEDTFRAYEHQMLINTNPANTIVSTGGGIIESQQNINWLSTHQVIYLKTSWSEIVRRLQHDKNRPIWNDQTKDKLALLNAREEKYLQASKYVIQTDEKNPKEIANEIVRLIRINK
ncbi:shikimate kinase [Paraliobacillus ryukyuensis]|nr:shikimate kinase [Paraliobacillus ryukyuensis]